MLRSVVLSVLLGAGSVLGVKCSADSKCPKSTPCCSQYGECGVGAYCLGGCDPRLSFSLESCVPAPVCEDRKMKMNSLDNIMDIGKYLGDPSKADWVAQGEPKAYKDAVLLTMPKDSVGTVLSSTVYMWYGNVKAKMKSSRGRGVVTGFILFSDIQDEIDYEFVGVDLETAQTNFYFQGIPNYQNSANISTSDTFNDYHTYEINWTPDKIEWLIDGEVGRVKERKDTWNETTKNWEFPQTPARVQFSIWPGGKETNPEGTINWAGGKIDWEAADVKNNGYFYSTVSEVEIQCYKAKSAPGTNDKTSYVYEDEKGTNDTIADTDKKTVLASLQGTGTDMEKGKKKDKPTNSDKSKDKETSTKDSDAEETAASIPGGGSVGSGNDHSGEDTGSSDSSDSGSSSDSSDSDSGGSADATNCDTSSFNQRCGESADDSKDDDGKSEGARSSASALAIIIAGCALYWM